MKATLGLEWIGQDEWAQIDLYRRLLNMGRDGWGDEVTGRRSGKPWVAKITGADPRFGLGREFLSPRIDYSQANSKGSRGVYLWFVLDTGFFYEVYKHTSWRGRERYFAKVDDDGAISAIEKEAVMIWVSSLSA